jgi:hypothetical protein
MVSASVAELRPYWIKAAPAAPLARRQRPGSAVERLARRTPGHTRAGTQINTAHA